MLRDFDDRQAAAPEHDAAAQPAAPPVLFPALAGADIASRARVLSGLQRTAGNAAVARLMRPTLARYEAGEHSQMGAARTVTINGATMTEGELLALGDFYATGEDMLAAPKAELEKLRDLIRRDQDAMERFPGAKPVEQWEWDEAMPNRPPGKGYFDLLEDNASHFAPPSAGVGKPGQDHQSMFFAYHQQALDKAKAEATKSKQVPPDATALNGFAGHFLTDAFSAGHLFNKAEMLKRAEEAWKAVADEAWGWDVSNTFTQGVADFVFANRTAAAELAKWELKLDVWGPVTADRFAMFLYQVPSQEPEKFFNVILNIVHDRLDASIGDPETAIEVENGRGDRWTLAGDKSLSQSPKTLELAREAVALSFQNLEQAAKGAGSPLDRGEGAWKLTPKPTAAGAVNMEAVITKALNLADTPTMQAFADKTTENLDIGIKELVKKGYMRPKTAAPVP
jgi:hypothetical protein